MNAVTSFVDASVVYGNNEEMIQKLRDKNGHGIYFELENGRPKDNGLDDCLRRPGKNDVCYLAGDERVNEHPGLTAIHTLFMRKHNLWAHRIRQMVSSGVSGKDKLLESVGKISFWGLWER
ncbi:peroxidasin [Elysia marginata]|uniref:Peroxidasin n=1 Tax=Elysia marginata TaxID=1093978 RepID=A0AAV4GBN6_9GAST|nr:peroxidasin [Elysia marginata]